MSQYGRHPGSNLVLVGGYLQSTYSNDHCYRINTKNFFTMPPHVPYGLRGLPSRLWPKCNRLLWLGRP
jgi:hypothetical protein